MTKYLLLKHYRGGPAKHANATDMIHTWAPEEISAHVAFMDDMIEDLRARGEFVDSQALSPRGAFVRYDGEGRPPVTDGPFAETKDLIAGWMVIDVESDERAHEAAAHLSSAPGKDGRPLHEWIEVRPFLTDASEVTDVTEPAW
ncbi:YciI family protein [Myceligenerans crystallogenes]|uniref:YciI family protein n=1 Tax=Myceligenerans crystallogenes TaxID=316335 RepID=A0ABN2N8G8_9MICO